MQSPKMSEVDDLCLYYYEMVQAEKLLKKSIDSDDLEMIDFNSNRLQKMTDLYNESREKVKKYINE